MPFTPDFDQPGNTEVSDWHKDRAALENKIQANRIISSLDWSLLHDCREKPAPTQYTIKISGWPEEEVCKMVKAAYVGAGWNDVLFDKENGFRTTFTLVK